MHGVMRVLVLALTTVWGPLPLSDPKPSRLPKGGTSSFQDENLHGTGAGDWGAVELACARIEFENSSRTRL